MPSVRADAEHFDPRLPVGSRCLPLRLQVLRVLPHVQDPQQVLGADRKSSETNKERDLVLLLPQPHVAVEVCVRAGGVGVPQSDGVIGRAGEEG